MSGNGLSLPVLKLEREVEQSCDGSRCETCRLYKVMCHGCRPNPETSCGNQQRCATTCNTCHGDPPIPGVCCKSPLAGFAVDKILTMRTLQYHSVPMLDFPDERIPILLDRHHKSHAKVNAVGINRVYSARNKWKSRDIKDYLQLDKSSKLILTTVMPDNHLHKLIDDRWWETAPEVGIDYWEPMLFSTFMDESKMQRLFSLWRTHQSLVGSGAHIAPFSFHHLGALKIEDELVAPLRSIRNIGIGLSHGSEQIDAQRRIFGYVKKYAALLGPMAWFTQGLSSKPKQLVFKSILPPGSRVYFMVTPLTGRRRSNDQYGWFDK